MYVALEYSGTLRKSDVTLWNGKKEWLETSSKIRWGKKNKLSGLSESIQRRASPKVYPYYFLLGVALKIPKKAINPFLVDGFLHEAWVQRGLQGCVSLLSLSHGESNLVQLLSSKLRASRLVLALKAAWQSITVQVGTRFRNCWGRAPRDVWQRCSWEKSHRQELHHLKWARHLATKQIRPQIFTFLEHVLSVILRIILNQDRK